MVSGVRGGWFVVVLVHGLLVILDSRCFSSVEVRRWVGPCTMGELKLIGWVEVHRHGDSCTGTPANKKIIICAHHFRVEIGL